MSEFADTPYPSPVTVAGKEPEGDLPIASAPCYLTLSYQENIYTQLDGMVSSGALLDGLIIDLMQTGFSLQMEQLGKFVAYGKKLLNPHGVVLFIKSDAAMVLTRDDPGGGLVVNVYDSPYSALTRYPLLADQACATVTGIDRKRLKEGGGTLSNHILFSSVPVLTPAGKTAKGDFDLPVTSNWVIQLIDDYSSIESIVHKLDTRQLLNSQDTLCILQELEKDKLIYPVFSRLQFLANCYQSRKPFRIGHYMLAAGIVNEMQLQELLEKQQEEGWGQSQRTLLGVLAVRAGYLNMRELQVLLGDQYLYGGYHRLWDETMPGGSMVDVNTVRDSMIGSLAVIDPPGLLQSLNTANKTGLLTCEDREQVLLVAFANGRATHARLNELRGFDALSEFITIWADGIFVFRDKGISAELDKSTELAATLDRVLLDSALYADNINQILGGLPQGRESMLERAKDFDQRFAELSAIKLRYMDEDEVTADDLIKIKELARHANGMSTLNEIVSSYGVWPTHKIFKAIELLMRNELLVQQKASLFRPLSVFQQIVAEMRELIGGETNKVILHSSLHYVFGEAPSKSLFLIDQEGYISVNVSELKNSGTSASSILPELRQWMEAYIAYGRQKVEPAVVDEMVKRIVRETN